MRPNWMRRLGWPGHRQRVPIEETFKLVVQSDHNPAGFASIIPLCLATAWYWLTGVPEGALEAGNAEDDEEGGKQHGAAP